MVNGEEGREWPYMVAGSAFRVQQPGAGTRDWTRTRCDDCADDWGSPSRVDGRTCCLQRFALGGACPARRKTVAGAPFFKRQPLAGRSNHGARFFKRQRIAGRRHHATTNCDRTTARHFSSDSASLTVDIMRRQFAVSLLRRGQCAGPYLSAQIQRGNVEAWTPRALRMSKSACAQCSACFVTHARHGMAMLFC